MGIWAEQLWNSDARAIVSETVVGKMLDFGFPGVIGNLLPS